VEGICGHSAAACQAYQNQQRRARPRCANAKTITAGCVKRDAGQAPQFHCLFAFILGKSSHGTSATRQNMKTRNVTRYEWDDLADWEVTELIPDFDAFQIVFMTAAELGRYRGTSSDVMPLSDEAEAKLVDEMQAWHEQRRAKTLALAQRLECSLYLAAYLLHLNEKLERVADAFRSRKVVVREPGGRRKKK
jgi:hypothetical protein